MDRPHLETHRYGLTQVPTLGLRSLKTPLLCVTLCRGMGLVDLTPPPFPCLLDIKKYLSLGVHTKAFGEVVKGDS